MRSDVVRALNRLNLAFYSEHAGSFDSRRGAPWPGWRRVLRHAARVPADPLRVLDAACGNGHLALALDADLVRPWVYRGVDASASLLERARRALEGLPAELSHAELVEQPPGRSLPAGPFDLVAAFGLLHHVPGEPQRRALIEALARRVAPGGLLALAFWDFGAHARFRARQLPWSAAGLDERDVEPGDALLRWGPEGSGAARYCHWCDAAEEARLLAGLELAPLDAWSSDGRGDALNRYRVLLRS